MIQLTSKILDQNLLTSILAITTKRHKHLCPRQVLGVRMGLCGLQVLGLVDENYQPQFRNIRKRLLTFVETDGCGADGIVAAVDCHVGKRTLRVEDYGKMAATLVDRHTKRCIRISPRPESRELAEIYVPQAKSRWHAYLEAYQIIPDDELLHVQEVTLTKSISAIISRPGVRTTCTTCGEEVMNERELAVNGRVLCQPCANQTAYYSEIGD